MADRLACCIPHCTRTTKPEPDTLEWMCGMHWRLVRGDRKRVYTRAKLLAASGGDQFDIDRAYAIWKTLKREVIEKEAGI